MSKRRNRYNSKILPWRIYLLFGLVLVLFSALIWRLAYMQLSNKDFYIKKLATASKTRVTTSSVRGEIFDAQGQPVVVNKTKEVLSFTRDNKMSAADLKKLARKLVEVLSLPEEKISDRQKLDYYLSDPEIYQKVVAGLPKDKRLDGDGNRYPEDQIYQEALKTVPLSNLHYSPEEEKVIGLYSQLNAVANFQTQNLNVGSLSKEQIHQINSYASEYPGISVTKSWDRQVLDTPLASIVGHVSSEQAGLPEEEADDYLKKGYALNDRVGVSYLEKSYEEVLQGKHAVKEIHLDRDGNLDSVSNLSQGKKGNDLKLTVDMKFQTEVEKILRKHLQAEVSQGNATESPGVYAVALNPNDGSVLAMAGIERDPKTGEYRSNALSTVTDVFVPGSVVKGATLTTAWQNGAIEGNEVLTDQPISLGGSSVISSWFTQYGSRSITAVQALEFSSNTYMVQVALRMLGINYGDGIHFSQEGLESAMTRLRKGFGQFGLGQATGIDLPKESEGYLPKDYTFSNYITNAFGQFDNYTPMQLAQYAATVAMDGKRIAPHLVQGIYEDKDGHLGGLVSSVDGKVLNQVNLDADYWALIKQGFSQVVYGSDAYTTGRAVGEGAAMTVSAKTGTAEVKTKSGRQAVNSNVVAFAPADNPQIAVAVVFPHNTDLLSTSSHRITRDIINLYVSHYGRPKALQEEVPEAKAPTDDEE